MKRKRAINLYCVNHGAVALSTPSSSMYTVAVIGGHENGPVRLLRHTNCRQSTGCPLASFLSSSPHHLCWSRVLLAESYRSLACHNPNHSSSFVAPAMPRLCRPPRPPLYHQVFAWDLPPSTTQQSFQGVYMFIEVSVHVCMYICERHLCLNCHIKIRYMLAL
jgi:hypothetical protein